MTRFDSGMWKVCKMHRNHSIAYSVCCALSFALFLYCQYDAGGGAIFLLLAIASGLQALRKYVQYDCLKADMEEGR